MTFLHLSLLGGIALVAAPILLHLLMRRKPTRMEFPAIRFLQKRLDVNRRRLQLRHLALLLLRMGLILTLALALARPVVRWSGALGNQEAPVAAALVFDVAPRMEYRHENKTRLDVAREFGAWLIAQLPEGSEIAVLDTRSGARNAFSPDRGAAKDRVAKLETAANARSLPASLDAAVRVLRQSRLERKEVYVFTDLARAAWPDGEAISMRQRLDGLPGLGVYVVDIGVARPVDYGLGQVQLSGDVLSNRGTLRVRTDLTCIGEPSRRTVELSLLDARGKPRRRGSQAGEASPGELRPIEFNLSGLETGMHQGVIRIVGQDGLAADDSRFFTVAVRPPWRLLVAAPEPADRYALFFTEAIAPAMYRKRGESRFDCEVCDLREIAKRPLDKYAAVCLLDPTPLAPPVWKKLADYAAEGHGVGVFLGRNAAPVDSFNATSAQELLPGKLLRQARRPDGDLWLAPRDFEHPVLQAFREQAGSIPWDAFPVFRYWDMDALAKGAKVVLPMNDGRPALVERPVGRGRVLVMTTPVSDRPNTSRSPWNLLPTGEAWPFLILANQMAAYLAGADDCQLNYLAGQTAVLPLDASSQRSGHMLIAPGGLRFPMSADLNRRDLTISTTDRVGNYQLLAGGVGAATLGFSVNYAVEQTSLDRLTDHDLEAVFGSVKFHLARTRDQIDRDVSVGRVGREMFPPLILIVALLMLLELFVSNRFYREAT